MLSVNKTLSGIRAIGNGDGAGKKPSLIVVKPSSDFYPGSISDAPIGLN